MVAPLPNSKPQPAAGQTSRALGPSDLPPETHTPDFNPRDPRQIETILDLFTNPDLSLRDIADQSNTTLQALTLWLARPDITEQLLDLECASVRRARFNISFALPKIAHALSRSLDQATTEAEHLDRLANNFPCFTLRLRYRENIRKSVSHLLRISGFDPTAKHRSESERRRRDEQTARWRERCGLSMLDKFDKPSDPSDSPIPQSEVRNPKSPQSPAPHAAASTPRSAHPPSDIRHPTFPAHPPSDIRHPTSPSHPTSSYMLIAADASGRTQIRGLTIPPELNKPGMPFTPVFDDTFDPSDLAGRSGPSVQGTPQRDPEDDPEDTPEDTSEDNQDPEDDELPFDFSNFSILSTRILSSLGLLTPDLSDVEVARGMILIQNAIDELDSDLCAMPYEEIVEKVSEHLFEKTTHDKTSSTSHARSRATHQPATRPPPTSRLNSSA